MKYNYEYNELDYSAKIFIYFFIAIIMTIIIAVIFISLRIEILDILGAKGNTGKLILSSIIIVVLLAIYFIIFFKISKSLLKVNFSNSTYGVLGIEKPFAQCSAFLKEDYFVIASKNIENKYYYKDIKKIMLKKEAFVLVTNNESLVIPTAGEMINFYNELIKIKDNK